MIKYKNITCLEGLFIVILIAVLFSSSVMAQNTIVTLTPYQWLRGSSFGGVDTNRSAYFSGGNEYRQLVEFDVYNYHTVNAAGGQLVSARLNFHVNRIVSSGNVVNVNQIESDLHIDQLDFGRASLDAVLTSGSNNNQDYSIDVTSIVSGLLNDSMPEATVPFWGQGVQFCFSDNSGSSTYGYTLSDVTLTIEIGPPVVCGDYNTDYLMGDISGPDGKPDCRVDLYDLDVFVSTWLNCTDPTTPEQCYPNDNPPIWYNNSLGKEDVVPSPWTNVQVPASNQVQVWGRTYTFDDIGLCTSIISSGQELLNSPMRFVTLLNGSSATFTATAPLSITSTATTAVITGTSISNVGNLPLTVKTTLEFDGFARIDVTLGSASIATTLNQFWFEVPLKSANAMYKQPSMSFETDIPPSGVKRPILGVSNWNNFTTTDLYWVGGDDVGFFLSAEDDRNWQSANGQEAQELVPGAGETIWRYHFIDPSVPRSMGDPLNLTYCYQATPVKPIADWYSVRSTVQASDYNINVQDGYDDGIRQGVFHEPWTEIDAYPGTFAHEEQLIEYQDKFKSRGMNLCLYTHPVISDAAPEFALWGQKWAATYPMQYFIKRNPKNGGQLVQSIYACNFDSSWADFIIYNWVRMINDYGVNGAFLDGTHGAGLSTNPVAYYEPNGQPGQTRTIFASRDFMKRWYKACKAVDPNFFFFGHTSGGEAYAPTTGFLSMGSTGETIGNLPQNTELPWNYLRAALTGRQLGVITELYKTGNYTEWYGMSLMLLHGGMVTPNTWGGQLVELCQKPAWDTRDSFGVSEANWVPYWKVGNEITSTNSDVKVSYHIKPQNVLLVAATNKFVKPNAAITIDLPALGIDPAHLRGWYCTPYLTPLYVQPDMDGKLILDYPGQDENGLGVLSNNWGFPNYVWLQSGPYTAFEDDFEAGTFEKWNDSGTTNWTISTSQYHSADKSAYRSIYKTDLVSDIMDMSQAHEFTVSFWYRYHNSGTFSMKLSNDGASYYGVTSPSSFGNGNPAPADQWNYYEVTINNSGSNTHFFAPGFRMRFSPTLSSNGVNIWIDDVKVVGN